MPDDDDPEAPVKLNDLDGQRFANALAKPAAPTPALVDLFRAPAAAEGADLDCWSPAAPAALALVADRQDASVIAAAITRGRERPHLVLIDRPARAPEPELPIDVRIDVGRPQTVAYRPQRVNCTPPPDSADVEYVVGEPVHWCGLCGQTFRIAPDDPHWSTGRGPICPPGAPKP